MRNWLSGIAVIVVAVIFLTHHQHYAREKYEAKRQQDCVALAVSAEQKYSCAKEAQDRENYAPWWYPLVAWPEGVTTWAIIGTGFVIAWQSNETRNAARATSDSVELQKIGFRQWIEIDDWKNATRYLQPTVKEAMIVIRCKVGNATRFPLILREVTVRQRGVIDTFAPNKQVAPDGWSPVDVCVRLGVAELGEYWKNNFVFGVEMTVIYEDALKKDRTHKFLYLIQCGPTRCDAEELSNQHEAEVVSQIGSIPAPVGDQHG